MPYGIDPPMDACAELHVLKDLVCRSRCIVISIDGIVLHIRTLPQDIFGETVDVSSRLLGPRRKS
jgi:hypothetical protein